MAKRIKTPGYADMEQAYLEYHRDSGTPQTELRAIFRAGIDQVVRTANRVTKDEIEAAVQRVRSMDSRTVEDLLTELGFEVTEH